MRPPWARTLSLKRLLLIVAAVVGLLPCLSPSIQVYVDNAPHLVEVAGMAEAWPAVVSWTDRANAGMALGQLNAPLAWWPLAGLHRAGVPPVPLYVACIFLSNLMFAFGTWKLGERLIGCDAGWIAAVLATCSVFDLYGIAGAAGGMWPFRLACGLLMYGIGARWKGGLWLAAVMLLHTFTAVAAVLVTAVLAVREPRRMLHLLVGLAIAAFWWGPLLDPALRGFAGHWEMNLGDTLSVMLYPGEVFHWRLTGEARAVGGAPGLAFVAVAGVGAILALLRPRVEDRVLAIHLGGVVAVFVLVGAVFYPLFNFQYFGPNPWRHYLWVRVALAMVAGVGLVALPARVKGLLAVGLAILAAWAGGRELEMDPERLDQLEATWELLPEGRVFHEDTLHKPGAPEDLAGGHAGALLGLDRPVLGSWYTVSSIATVPYTASEAGIIAGHLYPPEPESLHRTLRAYGVSSLVSVSGLELPSTHFEDLGGEGPFRAWRVLGDPQPLVGARDGSVELGHSTPTGVVATVPAGPFRVRRTFHPWWSATLDGELIELGPGSTGLVEGVAPAPGKLEIIWKNQGSSWAWLSLFGLLLAAVLAILTRRDRRWPAPARR